MTTNTLECKNAKTIASILLESKFFQDRIGRGRVTLATAYFTILDLGGYKFSDKDIFTTLEILVEKQILILDRPYVPWNGKVPWRQDGSLSGTLTNIMSVDYITFHRLGLRG